MFPPPTPRGPRASGPSSRGSFPCAPLGARARWLLSPPRVPLIPFAPGDPVPAGRPQLGAPPRRTARGPARSSPTLDAAPVRSGCWRGPSSELRLCPVTEEDAETGEEGGGGGGAGGG
ncbi:hypothetical protein chiPu_0022267 [Chiloscyllium punctatum]|uniref:Uncharacterized protein n=1 Tax=Chiloscyllium punctatum TaxID=137246 RepID=A0A401RGL2_CHIPU|nr:hypothetical protein [Chiloscyllium punctatum]